MSKIVAFFQEVGNILSLAVTHLKNETTCHPCYVSLESERMVEGRAADLLATGTMARLSIFPTQMRRICLTLLAKGAISHENAESPSK